MKRFVAAVAGAVTAVAISVPAVGAQDISLEHLGTFVGGGETAAEIAAYSPRGHSLYITNGESDRIDIVDISDPGSPSLTGTIDLAAMGYGAPTSVASHGRTLAVATVGQPTSQHEGKVVFFDLEGEFKAEKTVGSLPDMVTFTPDGKHLLVANEGEPSPDYLIDPPGSVSIIEMNGGKPGRVRTADFEQYDGKEDRLREKGIRIFGLFDAPASQDLEPEYIAVSGNSRTAWVVLQENNAVAVIDIKKARVTDLHPLGFKDHSIDMNRFGSSNALDASDEDNGIDILNWPIFGMYLPDGIAWLAGRGQGYLLTANEGDAREYIDDADNDVLVEETRIEDLDLDPVAFPDADVLKLPENLGRLNVTSTLGQNENGLYEELYAFGGRSFSVWDASSGKLVWDSGDQFEQVTASVADASDVFNSNQEPGTFDERSDNKGPEPEGLSVGKVGRRTYAFIGLERVGGVMVYDVTDPKRPRFVEWARGDQKPVPDFGPEGVLFIAADDSPLEDTPLVVVTNEISGTTSIWSVGQA